MKAFLLSIAGLAGLALSAAPAVAHGYYRECRRPCVVGHRACYRYPVRCRSPYRHCGYYRSYRYCPPPCRR
jgi:hypothetical protein